MQRICSIVFMLAGLLVFQFGFAQLSSEHESLVYQEQIDLDWPATSVSLMQRGNSNEAFIQQVNTAMTLDALQIGNSNLIWLGQSGYNNGFRIIQSGDRNSYEGSVVGFNSLVEIVQNGGLNSITSDVVISNSALSISQTGNGHLVEYSGSLDQSPGLIITQQGQGMKLIIKTN